MNKYFLISKKLSVKYLSIFLLLSFSVMSFAQQGIVITGTVTESGEPLPGVTIQIRGTTMGYATDVDGRYSITVPDENAVLVFSFIGYNTVERTVGNMRIIDVEMSDDAQQMDELVVVGYGVMRRSDVTGAVLSVSDEQLRDRPVSNVMEALQGKAAGVDITTNVRPGELGSIRIRGERSITGGNNPLYVVDGIPIFGRNNINSINTQDIKSIEILKDASATAIYGSRGANGVILITTYAGEEGRFTVNYSGSLTFSKVMDSAERYDAGEWVNVVRWANYYANPAVYEPGDAPTESNDFNIFDKDVFARNNVMKGWVNGQWDPSRVTTTDWTKFIARTGVTQNHTVSVSGGTARVSNYASFGYLDEKGTLIGQRFKRYTLSLNSTSKPVDWFEIGGRLNGSWTEQEYGLDTGQSGGSNAGAGNIFEAAVRLYPHAVPYDDDGNVIPMPGGDNRRLTIVNEHMLNANERQMLNVMANVYAQIALPLDGLSYRVEFGPSFRYRQNGIMTLEGSSSRDGSSGHRIRLSNQRDFVWTVNNIISYNKVYDIHSFNVTLLQTASKTSETGSNIYGQGDLYAPARWNAFATSHVGAGLIEGIGSSISEEQLTSYMARINYGFNNRYLLTVSGRWDGSSVLAEGNKWAFFPSASVAWRLEQEDFIKAIPVINQLKLRLGYGVTGNAAVSRYSTKGTITERFFPYGDQQDPFYFTYDRYYGSSSTGTTPTLLPNKDLGWEKTAQFNVGIDFSVLRGRIGGVFEVYRSTTTDLLLSSSIPSQVGYLRTLANVGKTEGHGVEITLNTINVRTQNGFTWETSTNVAWQKDKIVELSNGKEDEIAGATDTRLIGKPLGIYYHYQANGIWRDEDTEEKAKFAATTHPVTGEEKAPQVFPSGRVRVVDQNGDYVIDNNFDRTFIGQSRPKWTVGMNNTFSYKGLELLVAIYGRLGHYTNGASVNNNGFWVTRKIDYYTEVNTNAKYQRPEISSQGSDLDPYSGALDYVKASFINIRHITLGYRFPREMISNWGSMQSLRIYAQVVNPAALYSACDFKNMDVNSSFWNRNFVFGLNVGF